MGRGRAADSVVSASLPAKWCRPVRPQREAKEATLAKANQRHRYAKLRLAPANPSRASLVELLGVVGE